MKSYVVYQFDYPGCNDSYIDKTELDLCARTAEHACSDNEIILTTAVIIAILKIYSVSIMVYLIKYYLVSTQSKVT